MKVVIIAGGKGTRIASVNSEIPKAMIPVEGKPIIEHEVLLALRYGFKDFIFIIGHLGEHIRQHFGDGSRWGAHIEYFQEEQPLGTAGALGSLREQIDEDFFVFYGDTIMDIDMHAMLVPMPHCFCILTTTPTTPTWWTSMKREECAASC